MKAWRIHGYGGPEQLKLEDAPDPQPAADEVRVRVGAASVNPIDWKMRAGVLRALFELRFPRILGRDCAGVIDHSADAALPAGARVLAVAAQGGQGTHAELACVPAVTTARIPDDIDDATAVALGVAGASAWIPLVDVAGLKAGQRVLIHAGAGGVGHIAVQLARHLGAEVLTTCGAVNLDYVKSIGAHRAIDYRAEDFTRVATDCDVVLDTLGGETHRRSFACLKPGGVIARLSAEPVDPVPPRDDVRSEQARVIASRDRLEKLLALVQSGAIRPLVSKRVPFAALPEAYAAVESGHTRGKVVVTLP